MLIILMIDEQVLQEKILILLFYRLYACVRGVVVESPSLNSFSRR